jgi:GlpG protein
MRQLTTLPTAAAARTLADYLLTQKIDTRLLAEEGGWGVWVCDEDRLAQARQELADFERNPTDARFTRAAGIAETLRQKERQTEEEYQRRDARFRRRMARATEGNRALTVTLIVVCVLVSLLSRGGSLIHAPWLSLLLISPLDFRDGAWWTYPGLFAVEQGQVWRLVTPIFIHFGPWHLLFNMTVLYRLGGEVERRRGWWRLLLLVLVIAVPSNLAQYYLGHVTDDWKIHTAPLFGGMSGVLYGLLGYLWMKVRFEPDLGLQIQPSTVLWLMMWFFLCASREFQELIGMHVANMAHAAGLVSGLVLGVVPPLARHLWFTLRGGHGH